MNQPTIRFSKAARRRYTHTAAPAVQRRPQRQLLPAAQWLPRQPSRRR